MTGSPIGSAFGWEYRVIHIDVESGNPPEPPSPQSDSERLGGALSPEFLEREFPQQYTPLNSTPRHPAEQLQFFLNALGREHWEMVEAAQVGPLLMFVFKRPLASAGGPLGADPGAGPSVT
jgi:hypothetical protein